MESFYWIVLMIAVVFMIIGLTASAMMLQHQSAEEVFPKSHSPCPDGWKHDNGTCILHDQSSTDSSDHILATTHNNFNSTVGLDIASYNTNPTSLTDKVVDVGGSSYAAGANSYSKFVFKSDATRCQKKEWANHHGIKWDGITNYNNCK